MNPPLVIDDFGDVYGILLAVTGEGYSYKELLDYVDYLRRELELIDGVSKVSVSGQQQEQVFIEISMKRINTLGISPQTVFNLLSTQNLVSDAGAIRIGSEYIRIHPTGEFDDVEKLGDLILSERGAQGLIYLRDVAEVKRGYVEVPSNVITFNGKLALNVGSRLLKASTWWKSGNASIAVWPSSNINNRSGLILPKCIASPKKSINRSVVLW